MTRVPVQAAALSVAKSLPTKNGVGPSCVPLPAGAWPSLLDFLVERFAAIPRSEWLTRLHAGDVLDAQGCALPADQSYLPHSKVYYYRSLCAELPIPFEATVLYQDAHLVVADKPHFLPVIPAGRYLQETLLVRLKRQLGCDSLTPLHRIDRDTAGLVLFSADVTTRGAYAALFRERCIVKHYEAVAPWRADLALPMDYESRIVEGDTFMTMREVPGEPNAQTHIALLEHNGTLARYSLSPHTGRHHQLRVQMAGLEMPILNDGMYPNLTPECPPGTAPDYSRPLQLLAKALAFTDPVTGEARTLESRLSLQALNAG